MFKFKSKQLDLAELDFGGQDVYIFYASCNRTYEGLAKVEHAHATNIKSSSDSIFLKKYHMGDQNSHRLTLQLSKQNCLKTVVDYAISGNKHALEIHNPKLSDNVPAEKPTVWKVVYQSRVRRKLNSTSQHLTAIHQFARKSPDITYKRIAAEQLDRHKNKFKESDVIILPYGYEDINKNGKNSVYGRLCSKVRKGRILNKEAILLRSKDEGLGSKRGFARFAKKHKLPIPRTWMGERFLELKRKPKLNSYVVKKSIGAMGAEVHLCDTHKEVEEILNKYGPKNCIVQEKIETKTPVEDIRIWIVCGEPVGSLKRRVSHDSEDFRTNLSLGGSGEIYEPSSEELSLAIKAYELSGLDFVAFDLIADTEGKLYFIEANITPGLESTSKILKNLKHDFAKAIMKRSYEMLDSEYKHIPSWKKR